MVRRGLRSRALLPLHPLTLPVLFVILLPGTLLARTALMQDPSSLPGAREVGEAAWSHVRVLAGEIGARPAGSEAEARGMAYADRILASYGYDVRHPAVGVVEFAPDRRPAWYPDRFELDASNLVAVKPGRLPAIVLSAHMDSVDRLAPGANDDASGVAALLEAARLLRTIETSHEIRFAIFTGEEHGLIGGFSYAMGLAEGEVGVVVNSDPMGYGTITAAPMPTAAPFWFQRAALAESRRLGLDRYRIVPAWILLPRLIPIPFGADHQPFLAAGLPAWSLSNRMDRWSYHTSEDTPEIIDPQTVGQGALLLTALAMRFDSDMPDPGSGMGPRYGVLRLPWGTVLPHGARQSLLIVLGFMLVLIPFLLGRRSMLPRATGMVRALIIAAAAGIGVGIPVFLDRLVSGFEHPWMAQPFLFLLFGVAAGSACAWLAARLLAHWQPRQGDASLAGAAALWALIGIPAWLLAGPDFAVPFAWGAAGSVVALFLMRALPGPTGGALPLLILLIGVWPVAALASPWAIRDAVTLAGIEIPGAVLAATRVLLAWPVVLSLQGIWPALSGLRDDGESGGPQRARALCRPSFGAGLGAVAAAGCIAALMLPAYRPGWRQLVEVDTRLDGEGVPISVEARSWDALKGVQSAWPNSASADGRHLTMELPADPPKTGFSLSARLDTIRISPRWLEAHLEVTAVSPVLSEAMVLQFSCPDSAWVAGGWLRPTLSGSGFERRVRAAGAAFTRTWDTAIRIRSGTGLTLRVILYSEGDPAGALVSPQASRRREVVVDPHVRTLADFQFGIPAGAAGGR